MHIIAVFFGNMHVYCIALIFGKMHVNTVFFFWKYTCPIAFVYWFWRKMHVQFSFGNMHNLLHVHNFGKMHV
jgi:hypothetical protein